MKQSQRCRNQSGFSTLEVVISLSVFLVVAAGLTSVAMQMVSSTARTEARASAGAMLDNQLAVVAASPFEDLLVGFTAPNPCGGGSATDSRRSCVSLGNRDYRIDYDISVEGVDKSVGEGHAATAVRVTASTRLKDGSTLTRDRVVAAPASGYFGTDAVLRVVGIADGAEMPPVNILDAAGNVVLDGATFTDGVSLMRVPGDSCAGDGGGPCRLALSFSAGSWWQSGDLTLYPENILGDTAALILEPATLTEARLQVGVVGSAQLRVRAQATGRAPVGGAPDSSVCMWASFDDGLSLRHVPYCNNDGQGNILIENWPAPDGGAPLPFPSGFEVTLSVENPASSQCIPAGDYPYGGPKGYTSGSWVTADVCTSWTWGRPGLFAATGDAGDAYEDGAAVLMGAPQSSYDLTYLDTLGRPATGGSDVPAWSKPRDAALEPVAGCATDSDDQTLCVDSSAVANTPTPETAAGAPGTCGTDLYCLSSVNLPPQLTIPSFPYTVHVPNYTDTPFTLTATDPEGDNIQLQLVPKAGIPEQLILDEITGDPIFAGIWMVPSVGLDSWSLRFSSMNPLNAMRSFRFELTDGTSSSTYDVGFYSNVGAYTLVADDISIAQGAAGVAATATLYDNTGARMAGETVHFNSTATGLTGTGSTTTNSEGVAVFPLNSSNAVAGEFTATFTSGMYGYAGVGVNVEQAVETVELDGGGTTVAQGGSFTATVTASDYVGNPVMGATATFAASDNDGPSTKLRPAAGSCVTNSSGVCATVVGVAGDAPRGVYTLTATTGDGEDSQDVEVTSTAASISAGDGISGSQRYHNTVVGTSPVVYWQLDDTTGTTSDVNGSASTYPGTVDATIEREQAPLGASAKGHSMKASADGAGVCTTSGGPFISGGGATIEAWVNITTHKPDPTEHSELVGVPGFSLRSGDGVNQERPAVVANINNTEHIISGGGLLSAGVAHHLVATFKNDTVTLYQNGEVVASEVFAGGTLTTPGDLCAFSLSGGSSDDSLDGYIDEVSLYDQGLGAATVATHVGAAELTGSGGTLTASQGELLNFEARVLDGADEAMVGSTVSVVSHDQDITAGDAAVTNSAGVAQLAVTVDGATGAGVHQDALTVSVGGLEQSVSLEVQAVAAAVRVDDMTVVAGGEADLVATVTDAADNAVAGVRVLFSWPDGSPPSGMRWARSATTDSDGVARSTISPAARVAGGNYLLRASVNGYNADALVSVQASDTALSTDGADFIPSIIESGGSGAWTSRIVNASGVPVEGVAVSLGCDSCGLGFSPSSVDSDTDGWVTFDVTDVDGANPAGNYPIAVSIGGKETVSRVTVTGVVTDLAVSDSILEVSGGETVTVAVTATDTDGEPVSNAAIKLSGSSAVGLRSATTRGNGIAVVQLSAPANSGTHAIVLSSGAATVELSMVVQ